MVGVSGLVGLLWDQIVAVGLDTAVWRKGTRMGSPGERERNFECQNCGKFRMKLEQTKSGLEYAKNQGEQKLAHRGHEESRQR